MREWQPILWETPHSCAEKTLAQENLAFFQCFHTIFRSHHSSTLRDHFLSPLCCHSKSWIFFLPKAWQKSLCNIREKSINNSFKIIPNIFLLTWLHFLSYIEVQFGCIKGAESHLNSSRCPRPWGFWKGPVLHHDCESFVNWKRMDDAEEDALSQADSIRAGFFHL